MYNLLVKIEEAFWMVGLLVWSLFVVTVFVYTIVRFATFAYYQAKSRFFDQLIEKGAERGNTRADQET